MVPECSQCLKAAKVCNGYRTESDFLFHDYTKASNSVIRSRSQRRRSKVLSSAPGLPEIAGCTVAVGSFVESEPTKQLAQQHFSSLRYASPPGSMRDQALCFFFSRYGTQHSTEHHGGFWVHLSDMYKDVADNHTLKHIVPAIGLGGLARQRECLRLLAAADFAYNKALRLTNSALCQRETAASDETLIGVVLLGLYETDICSKPQSSRVWLGHIQGASALLELRGTAQMQTALGRELFELLRSQIFLRCSLTRCSTPPAIVTLSDECKKFRASPADELASISNELGQLRLERPFRPHRLDSECLDRDVIRRCLSLGFKLEAWRSQTMTVPPPGPVAVEVLKKDASGNRNGIYSDDWTVRLQNRHRGLVILVEELAITRLLNLQRKKLATTQEILQLHDLRHNIIQQVDKICVSVPRLLESGSIEAARSLLWPLYMAAQLDPATVRCNGVTRDWMLGRLRFIGYGTGIRQSLFLVEVLSKREEVNDLLGGSHSGAECVSEDSPLVELCSA